MRFSERQWNARAALLCHGDEMHIVPLPEVRSGGGVMGDLRCEECGSAMDLVHVLTVAEKATLRDLEFHRRPPLYTTAKLNVMSALSAIAAASSHGTGETDE